MKSFKCICFYFICLGLYLKWRISDARSYILQVLILYPDFPILQIAEDNRNPQASMCMRNSVLSQQVSKIRTSIRASEHAMQASECLVGMSISFSTAWRLVLCVPCTLWTNFFIFIIIFCRIPLDYHTFPSLTLVYLQILKQIKRLKVTK